MVLSLRPIRPDAFTAIHEIELNSDVRPKALPAGMFLGLTEIRNDTGDSFTSGPGI